MSVFGSLGEKVGKTLGTGIVGKIAIFVLILLVVALGAAAGGIVGAGIAAAYNLIFGTSFALTKFALIGSIVGVAGGASSDSD